MKKNDFKDLLATAQLHVSASMQYKPQDEQQLRHNDPCHLEKVKRLSYMHEVGRKFVQHVDEHKIMDFDKFREHPTEGGVMQRDYDNMVFVFTKEQALKILNALPE